MSGIIIPNLGKNPIIIKDVPEQPFSQVAVIIRIIAI
jgi:hypothetical protein